MELHLTERELYLLHRYFNKHRLHFLNSELYKLLEGKDLEVSDKTFFEIRDFNYAILNTPEAYKGKVYINIPKAAYERYKQNEGKIICNKTFCFGYTCADKNDFYLEIKSESAVSSNMLLQTQKDYVSYVFPKDTYFKVEEVTKNCIKLKETINDAETY